MVKTKDILCKVWLRRAANGILSRRLCGGDIADHLPTEQPQISNRQADMLVRNEHGALRHVEFQASNESRLGFRMLQYWVYFRGEYERPVKQCVFYIGNEPMRLSSVFEENGTTHRFEIINLQDYQADELLASEDWGDNLWALGAKGDRAVVLGELIGKVMKMTAEEQEAALAELTAFSGILKIVDLFQQKMKEIAMLEYDLSENAVIRPLIEAGRKKLVLELLKEKFGAVPEWANDKIQQALPEQLERWARRMVHNGTLEDVLS